MQPIWHWADHKSGSIRERNIFFWVSHLHMLRLKVPVHHETTHKKVFTKVICQRLPSACVQRAHLFSYCFQSSGRLILGCAHRAQNIAIEPGFWSSFLLNPKPNLFREISTLHCRLTLKSSRYRSYIHWSGHYRKVG